MSTQTDESLFIYFRSHCPPLCLADENLRVYVSDEWQMLNTSSPHTNRRPFRSSSLFGFLIPNLVSSYTASTKCEHLISKHTIRLFHHVLIYFSLIKFCLQLHAINQVRINYFRTQCIFLFLHHPLPSQVSDIHPPTSNYNSQVLATSLEYTIA